MHQMAVGTGVSFWRSIKSVQRWRQKASRSRLEVQPRRRLDRRLFHSGAPDDQFVTRCRTPPYVIATAAPAASMQTGASQEVARASPKVARASVILNRLTLVSTQHTDCVFAGFLLFLSVSCIFHYCVVCVRFYNNKIKLRRATNRSSWRLVVESTMLSECATWWWVTTRHLACCKHDSGD